MSKDVVLELLEKGKQRIASPDKWIKGMTASTAEGKYAIDMRDAVKWCAVGTINHEGRLHQLFPSDVYILDQAQYEAISLLGQMVPEWPLDSVDIVSFNDHEDTTHEDVMRVYDEAIQYRKDLLKYT